MPFIRLTMATPRPERRAEVRQHYEELVAYVARFPGFLGGWVLEPSEGTAVGEVGRLTLWETEADAHHAANDPHALSLHAELHFDVVGQLWDRSFQAVAAPPAG
jgi:heme-degrading monooxygenase HmoA